MHILFVVSWYKHPEKPMLGTFFEEQARALIHKGHKVGILYPDIKFDIFSRFKKNQEQPVNFNDHGLPTYYHWVTSLIPGSISLNYKYYAYSARRTFRKYIIDHGKPDILHGHSIFNGGIIAHSLSEKYSIPFVITEHFTGLIINRRWSEGQFKIIAEKVFQSASKVLVVSNSFKLDINKRFCIPSRKLDVHPNMVNSLFFNLDMVNLNKKKQIWKLFTNSFLTPKKNHKLLLDTVKILLENKINLILQIGGDGMLLSELRDYSKNIGIGSNVNFLGSLSRSEVKTELDNCDIYVATSQYETFGIAIAEALACGKPVVVTDSGGPRDFVNESNGLIVENHTPEAMANAILKLIRNYNGYNPDTIRLECWSRFNEENVTADVLKHYSNAILDFPN